MKKRNYNLLYKIIIINAIRKKERKESKNGRVITVIPVSLSQLVGILHMLELEFEPRTPHFSAFKMYKL